MCGIIGYTGRREAAPIIVEGLKGLEYRGYDSSGIALLDGARLRVIKKEGRISCLEAVLKNYSLSGTAAIGHTRWATHGKPSDDNAHPFISTANKFAVVHNGIIENYLEIKERLERKNIHFYSQTDSEVVTHLLEYHYSGDVKQAVMAAVSELRGTFALGVITTLEQGVIYAVKKDNPLIIGEGVGENYISSDVTSLQKFTSKVVVLQNCEIARVSADAIEVFDFSGRGKPIVPVDIEQAAPESDAEYSSYMEKEIREIPDALKRALELYAPQLENNPNYFKNIERVYFVGCGTAFHAGLVGKRLMKKLLPNLNIFAEMASEFRYDDFCIDDKTLTVAISQSGETADTLSSVRMVRERGGKVLSVCNVPISSLVFESDFVLFTNAGAEIAVASTKAYNCQLLVLTKFVLDFALLRGAITREDYENLLNEMRALPEKAAQILELDRFVAEFSKQNFTRKCVFYLGRGLDYYLAMEGSLKLKEISYIHSEAYAGGELKHGTLALIEDDVLVVAPVTQEALLDKMLSSLSEVKSRGATVISITPFFERAALIKVSDFIIPLPQTASVLYPILAVIPMQLFSYYIARAKGCDIDKPRNLAKSVTVE